MKCLPLKNQAEPKTTKYETEKFLLRKYKLVKEKKVTYPLDEWHEVERRAAVLSMKTGTYIRQISVNGQIVNCNFKDVTAVMNALRIIGKNINQLAKKANEINSIYEEDYENFKKEYKKFARPHQILCKKNKALPIRQDLKQRKNLKGSVFTMEKTSKELLKEFVNSQHFTSTTDIMNSMKELFSDVLQTVMEAELEEKLGYEKSERVSNACEENMSKNYRNGYSKNTVKTQLEEVDVKIPLDRNGDYSPQIIEKYNRNADGMEEKILALYACGMSQSDISE